MFQASNISLHIRNKKILDDVSIAIKPGAFTAVVGANGAGKSSLLKVLANEHPHFTGQVSVNGKQISDYSPKELSLVRAVLPQSSTLQFAFSVEQVVMLGRHAHKTTTQANQQIVDEIMEITGVSHLRERNLMTLSGGEKQRVHLARVLAQVWEETVYPRYVLLDEPTSSLDIAQQQNIFALAKRVCQRNIGVMAIVHDLNQAVQFADELYFMKEGKVVASGEAQEVFTKINIEETFCCRVNVYHDPCNKCPFIIPERETPLAFPQKLKVNQS
jgi:iron complex transport system ATP-binding protein